MIIALNLTNVFSFFLPLFLQVLDPDPAHEEPAFFSTSFNNLKSLILSAGPGVCLMPSMLRLFNCSPNLEALAIYSPKVILTPKTIPFVRYRCFYPFFFKIISPIYVLKF